MTTTDLEQRLEDLLVDLAERAPRSLGNADLVVSRVARRRRRRAVARATVSLVAIAGIAATIVALRAKSPSTASLSTASPSTLAPTIAGSQPADTNVTGTLPSNHGVRPLNDLGAVDWVVPTVLPDGFIYNHSRVDADAKSVTYSNHLLRAGFTISIDGVAASDPTAVTEIVDGISWTVSRLGPEVQMYSTRVNGQNVVVTASASLDAFTMSRVIGGLRASGDDFFPRPPVDLGDAASFVTAATATAANGHVVDLKIATDGGDYYCAKILTYTGCIVPLDGAAITKPSATILPDGTAVAYGAAASDVARIDLHLTDGRIVTVQPQDVHDAFSVNFYLIAGTYSSGLGIEQAVAFDASGNGLPGVAG